MKPVPLRQKAIVRDGLIRAGDLARLLSVSKVWLRVLANEGHIPEPVDGWYPLGMTLKRFAWYYRKLARQRSARRIQKAEIALTDAKTRMVELRCEEIERRMARRAR